MVLVYLKQCPRAVNQGNHKVVLQHEKVNQGWIRLNLLNETLWCEKTVNPFIHQLLSRRRVSELKWISWNLKSFSKDKWNSLKKKGHKMILCTNQQKNTCYSHQLGDRQHNQFKHGHSHQFEHRHSNQIGKLKMIWNLASSLTNSMYKRQSVFWWSVIQIAEFTNLLTISLPKG